MHNDGVHVRELVCANVVHIRGTRDVRRHRRTVIVHNASHFKLTANFCDHTCLTHMHTHQPNTMAISQRTVELHAALMCTGERLGYNFAKATRRQRYADVVHELKRCTGALSHAARREVVDELVMLLPNEDGDALMEAMADVIADEMVWITPSGTKYHAGTCRFARNNKTAMKIERSLARLQNKTPCKTCTPDDKKHAWAKTKCPTPAWVPEPTPRREPDIEVESDDSDVEDEYAGEEEEASGVQATLLAMQKELHGMRVRLHTAEQAAAAAQHTAELERARAEQAEADASAAREEAEEAEAARQEAKAARQHRKRAAQEAAAAQRYEEQRRHERRQAEKAATAPRRSRRHAAAAAPAPAAPAPAPAAPAPAASGPAVVPSRPVTRSQTAAQKSVLGNLAAGFANIASAVPGMAWAAPAVQEEDDAASMASGVTVAPPAARVVGQPPALTPRAPVHRVWVRKAGSTNKWHLREGGCHHTPRTGQVEEKAENKVNPINKCSRCLKKLA